MIWVMNDADEGVAWGNLDAASSAEELLAHQLRGWPWDAYVTR